MILEIVAGADDVQEIRDKETREIRGLSQRCYFRFPGEAYPVAGKIRVKARVSPGFYSFQPAFRIGRFGDLEINPFAVPELTPVKPEQVKAAS
jgi:hypothetical protein